MYAIWFESVTLATTYHAQTINEIDISYIAGYELLTINNFSFTMTGKSSFAGNGNSTSGGKIGNAIDHDNCTYDPATGILTTPVYGYYTAGYPNASNTYGYYYFTVTISY